MKPVLQTNPDDTPGAALEAAIRGVCHSTPHRRRCLSEDTLAPNSAPSPTAPQLRSGAASHAQACRLKSTRHGNEVFLAELSCCCLYRRPVSSFMWLNALLKNLAFAASSHAENSSVTSSSCQQRDEPFHTGMIYLCTCSVLHLLALSCTLRHPAPEMM